MNENIRKCKMCETELFEDEHNYCKDCDNKLYWEERAEEDFKKMKEEEDKRFCEEWDRTH